MIRNEISQLVKREIDLPRDVLITITRVETSANLIQAKVFISVLPEDRTESIFRLLNSRIYELQQKFNKRVKMRPVPRLIFIKEESTKEAGRVEQLLEEVKRRRDS